jgi:DNA modification methylase
MINVPIDSITPYPLNAKLHPSKQIDQIAASIKAFGFNQPIVVDSNNVIIVGHGRHEAAYKLGLTEVPVIKVDLTDEQARAYRLADNKLNESDWDMQLVIEELKGLSAPMLDLTGFNKDLLLESDEKDDEVPETPEEPTSKLGDLYILGNHRVLCGDSTKKEDVERLMDGKKADMVFTDPPYNMAYTGSATKRREKIENENMDNFGAFVTDATIAMVASAKVSAPFYMFTSEEEIPTIKQAYRDCGLKPHQTLIWKKHCIGFGASDYQHTYEPFVYGWTGHKERYMINQRNLSDVWEFARPASSELHPTMKPIDLIVFAMANSSKQDDIVLDLFLGSGSTLIAAEKTGRTCYGMELDPKYVDVIVKRWEDYTGNKATKVV